MRLAPPLLDRRALLVGGGAAALSAGCCRALADKPHRWNNARATDGADPERLLEPSGLRELVEIVRAAEGRRQSVRMAGSGHSFSDVAMNEAVMLLPTNLRRFLELPRQQLRAPHAEDRHLVRIEAGVTVGQADPELWGSGLSLEILGGYYMQTVVGAAATGTHGSSLVHGPICEQIVSYQLVVAGGEVLQVEPAQGITDPARFPGTIDTSEGPVPARLVQDDQTFWAVAVGLGSLGIVYAVVVRALPRFWLREVRTLLGWGEASAPGGVLDRIARGQRVDRDGPEPEYVEVYANPYLPRSGRKADRVCMLTRRYRLDALPASLGPGDRTRGPFGEAPVRYLSQVTGDGRAIVDQLNAHPERAPDFIDLELKGLVDDSYVARSYDVFMLGPANESRSFAVEVGVDLQQTIPAAERAFDVCIELQQQRQELLSAPVALRFVRGTKALLAMQQGRHTTMIELGLLVGARGAEDLARTFERRAVDELGARPHWGLDLNVLRSFDDVRRLYPATAEAWLAVYRRHNQSGVFNGRLTDRLGISVRS